MAVFVFELEAVLDQRRSAERLRQRALAEADAQRIEIEARARTIQQRLAAGRRSMRDALAGDRSRDSAAGAVRIEAVRMQASSSLHDLVLLQRAALELAGAQRRVEAARQLLLRAVVARKAVERLRARRYAAWLAEQNRREAAALDDLSVMRHARREEQMVAGDAA